MIFTYRFLLVFLLSVFIFIPSCKKDDPEERQVLIADDFEVGGTWYFQTVAGNGVISGIETSDTDPNPTGFITFNEDLTGYAEFSINLLNRSYGKTEVITWKRLSNNQVEITESDGDVDVWTLIRANDNIIEADWEVYFSAENNAVFTAVLTETP